MLKLIGGGVAKLFGAGNAGGIATLIIVVAALVFGIKFSDFRNDNKTLKAEVKQLKLDKVTMQTDFDFRIAEMQKVIKEVRDKSKADSVRWSNEMSIATSQVKSITAQRNQAIALRDSSNAALDRALSGLYCRERNFWGKLTGKLVKCND